MKHKIDWTMSGTVEFDTDETSAEAIAFEFQEAVSEGFDFMHHGEVDGVTVDEVDDEHVHNWLCFRPDTQDRCTRCGATRPHVHSWFAPRKVKDGAPPKYRQCLRCWDRESIAMSQPSSQGPCTCPEYAVARDCPRHEFMWDWLGSDPLKSRLREEAWRNGARPS